MFTVLCVSAITIQYLGGWYYLEYGTLRLRWDVESTFLLTIEEELNDEDSFFFKGICGNMDGVPYSNMSLLLVYECIC